MTTKHDDPEKSTPSPPQLPDPATEVVADGGTGAGVSNIVRRWRMREDLLKRGALAFRCFGFVFSLLAFLVTATNRHGDWRTFDKYEEYRYLLAISILSTLYTGFQALRQIRELSSGRQIFPAQNTAVVDFFGDQMVAYLLISAASAAVPLTNRMREDADNIFTDSSATAISMAFFAFLSLGLSALLSGYKLSNQTHI